MNISPLKEQEIKDKAHYISVTGIIYRKTRDGELEKTKYLICKRSMKEKIFPGKWCVPGGKLQQSDFINSKKDTKDHWFDVLEKVLTKEILEETNLIIDEINYVSNLALIRPNGFSTIIISLCAKYKSGEVKLQDDELTEFAWVSLEDAKNYDLIENIYEQLEAVEGRIN
jgi:8-oxo-dGTP pyrophosphatase MutT (NUDIX family)